MKNIIIDTDAGNEIDDQFALAYLLLSLKFDSDTLSVKNLGDSHQLSAITLAPYKHSYIYKNERDRATLMRHSRNEVEAVCDLCGFDSKNFIFDGSLGYIDKGSADMQNAAADKIIEIAKKGKEKTIIIAIGAITNIALAITKDPSIAQMLDVIWLGTNQTTYYSVKEFNFKQDKKALKIVAESMADLTIVPAWSVASHLYVSNEIGELYLKGKGELGNYLHELLLKFDKGTILSGKKIWDIGAVAALLFREAARLFDKTLLNKYAAMKIKNVKGFTVSDGGELIDDAHEKDVKMVVGFKAQEVLRDFFEKLDKHSKEKCG